MLTTLTKKSCEQKMNCNNKETHFVKEEQVQRKDGVGKTGHLWERLLISKVSPISNSEGLHFTEKNITRKPNTTTVRTNCLKESQQVRYDYTTILAHVNSWFDGIPPRAECLSCYWLVIR